MLDRRGNPVGTASAVALDAAEQALWRTMSFYGTPLDDLDAAQAADPAWAWPHIVKAGFLLSLTEPSVLPLAKAALDAAEPLLARAPQRERDHFAALRILEAGDWPGAGDAWQKLLLAHPRDALALQWAHLFDFYRGDAAALRQRVDSVLPAWSAADALHPYVLGLHAFGLEEDGRYAEAEAVGRAALDAARVPWAIHAVAHVMETQGRHAEGSAWMARWHADWTDGNGFRGHLGWHDALFALERLDLDAALAAFDAHLAATPEQIDLQRLDAASLLWRLHLLGAETGARWQHLLAGWSRSDDDAGRYPFNDLHLLLALLGAGDVAAAEDWTRTVSVRAEALAGRARGVDGDFAGAIAREVGVPLMRGMLAFAAGRCDEATRLLGPLRENAHRFGGSHAQRDVIDQTLIAAAAGAIDKSVGRALLDQRRLAKPATPLTSHWAARLAARRGAPTRADHAAVFDVEWRRAHFDLRR